MPKQFLICVLLYTAISAAPVCGQAQPIGNKPLAEISYRAVGKLIYLPVQVNGSNPLWFVFDTGAPNTIINTATAEKQKIKALSRDIIQGTGKGGVAAAVAGKIRLTLGGLTTHVTHAQIVDLSGVPLPTKVDGILGAEFIEQYVVRIDPTQHKIAFYDPTQFVYQGDGKSMPLELTNSRLYIRVSLATRPGELLERKLRVDTGSEDSVDDDSVRNSPNTKKTTLGNGLGTNYEDVSGVFDTVIIGPYTFRHVWGPAGAVSLVGMEMMRRFTLTFDTKHGLLYLEPNSSFNEPVPAPS
jgi:hypothetical protein